MDQNTNLLPENVIFERESNLPAGNTSIEVIIKYSGDLSKIATRFESIEILSPQYAIITGDLKNIATLYKEAFIEYVELPKILTYQLSNSRYSVCATRAQSFPYNLTGNGTVIGLIDSGIDFTHPDFLTSDGKSRILYIWDQTGNGTAPLGFRSGTEYTNAQINEALLQNDPISFLGFEDSDGHGTAVAGIAAGNGAASGGREKGIAPMASLIVVKLGRTGDGAFPRSTEVMRAIKYITDKARELGLPLSINLSYGTNNGSHSGSSLFEQYVNEAANEWKTVICVAAGNEGDTGHHYSAMLSQGESIEVPFTVSGAKSDFYITLWKNFSDDLSFTVTSPQNTNTPLITPIPQRNSFEINNTQLSVFYGQPSTYTTEQEVYFLFKSTEEFMDQGLWIITIFANSIVDGRIDMWLPTVDDVTYDTAFSFPDPSVTVTLPATSENVISVGGYDSDSNTLAIFSGRGYTRNNVFIKPDITAPAVNILTTRAGGNYMQVSGTSFSSPFVAGASALLMEWGIVQKNDVFLYGQRIKAFLQKSARRDNTTVYPNNLWGYGRLCISSALDLLTEYNQEGESL